MDFNHNNCYNKITLKVKIQVKIKQSYKIFTKWNLEGLVHFRFPINSKIFHQIMMITFLKKLAQ
jgi:hypothetical protein